MHDLLMVHITETLKWRKCNVTGATIPPPRGGHCAVAVGDIMYMFGGFDGRVHYNDLWMLDTGWYRTRSFVLPSQLLISSCIVSWQWSIPATTGAAPQVRSGHTATVLGSRMYIVGGCGSNAAFLRDVHRLDLGAYFIFFIVCVLISSCHRVIGVDAKCYVGRAWLRSSLSSHMCRAWQ